MQGCKVDSILALESADEHTRLRKAFSHFFTQENVDKVLTQLTRQVADACDDVATRARKARDGVASINMVDLCHSLIDNIVQNVRPLLAHRHALALLGRH